MPDQSYCADEACQRERKKLWQRDRRTSDPDYRDNQARAQDAWLARNPDYWRRYAPWEEIYISRDWLDEELKDQPPDSAESLKPKEPFKSRDGFPFSVLRQAEILEDLVDCAARHFENTGRYLQVWGELGEIYAEIKFGLRRHWTHRAGSDGTIDGRLVDVKTISPEKSSDQVLVKTQGDFEQLLLMRIDADFGFTGKLFEREELSGGEGRYLRARFRLDPDRP